MTMATRSRSRSSSRTCMGAMCKDVVVGSTANRQMYIDMGWQLSGLARGVPGRGRRGGRTLPQTTRVRKAINKQDTSRMSNINNKNESRWRTLHSPHYLPSSLSHPSQSCHSEHSHEWCLNGNVWVAAGTGGARQGCLLIYAVPIGATWDPKTSDRFAPTSIPAPTPFPPLNLPQIENIYVLCKANCVVYSISKE